MQLKEDTLFDGRYLLKKFLGSGGFSEVWLAEDTEVNHKKRALKIYTPEKGLDERGITIFRNEFEIVCDLNHTHLLRPEHYEVCNGSPYLVMPYCENGSAEQFIGDITEEEAWHFLHDVASGLAYLHEQKLPIIHQDIKPHNILVNSAGCYLITDFGISAKARSTLRRSMGEAKANMTVAYTPPERFDKNNAPIMASDVWSLGATLFELLEGDVPFFDALGGLAQRNGADIPEIKSAWSPELKKIVTRCLQKEPWNRPTAAQLIRWTEDHFKGKKSELEPEPEPKPEPKPDPPLSPTHPTENININIEMIHVAGGTFVKRNIDIFLGEISEGHQVAVSSFMIGKYQITQREWRAVMGNNPSHFTGENLPVENVSWNDVQKFIEKLNRQTGKQYRLPTEEEWEYAARGGSKSKNYKFSGSNLVEHVAWYSGNSEETTHRVGTKLPNELGIHDMSGNVGEWCFSLKDELKKFRGGSWLNSEGSVLISTCGITSPSDHSSSIGFRLACS